MHFVKTLKWTIYEIKNISEIGVFFVRNWLFGGDRRWKKRDESIGEGKWGRKIIE